MYDDPSTPEPDDEEIARYNLVHSFQIDNGELDGIKQHECFVLGVEWAMFKDKLEQGADFAMTIHWHNRHRLHDLATSSNATYVYYNPNNANGWTTIEVKFPEIK